MASALVPPNSIEAEQALLGSMMIESQAVYRAVSIVKTVDFYRPTHGHIFDVVVFLTRQGQPVDIVTVQEELRSRGQLDEVGGTQYLMALLDSVPTAANVESYARIVKDKSTLRRVEAIGRQIQAAAHQTDVDCQDVVQAMTQWVLDVKAGREESAWLSAYDLIKNTVEVLSERSEKGGVKPIFRTGMSKVDWLIEDLKGFTLFLARPSQGKSASILQVLIESMDTLPGPVAVFSPEMDEESIGIRLLSYDSGLSMGQLTKAALSHDDRLQLVTSAGRLSNLPVLLDTSTWDLSEIVAKTKLAILEHNICAVFIDYVQLLRTHGDDLYTRNVNISQTLKALHKDTGIKVIGAAQFNRDVDRRKSSDNAKMREPRLSDILGGGQYEQDLDLAIAIHNPHATDGDSSEYKPAKWIIIKHRNGKTGSVDCLWHGECQRFRQIETNMEPPIPYYNRED